jgi:uroporphyrinogen III methyltransferase/synthase
MKKSPTVFKAGTRPSSLALTQTRHALDRIEAMLNNVVFQDVPITSVGDTDRTTDLRESPPDFFTRELDKALRAGEIDLAVHSAKDLPDPMPDDIDWFWLPWREEPRDVLIFAEGKSAAELPDRPVVGVSSDRRSEYCSRRFPHAVQKNIRGNIEERIAQVDDGTYDAVIMAAAALNRLGLEDRISEWIGLDELEVPEGQGYLAVTFRRGDPGMQALRNLFVPAVTFAGAGIGDQSLCTAAALKALGQCDICLHDSLIDLRLLDRLPPHACAIDVGKRCGAHSREQHETTRLICACARQSRRIVRLKSGDPGIFGRLTEETGALEELGIAYRVIPGISALQAATTGTGMLPTRRNVSRGFTALTPRKSGGELAPCDAGMRSRLPLVYYMSIKAIDHVARELLYEGWAPDTPAAVVYNAGGEDEQIIRTTLAKLQEQSEPHCIRQPGLVMVGDITAYSYRSDLGALRGRRVLLTCSDALQEKAADCVCGFGGRPVALPLIELVHRPGLQLDFSGFDWIAITSPSSVRALMELVQEQKTDLRSFPKVMVCGRGTADECEQYGIYPEAQPERGFSADSLIELAGRTIGPGEKILRVRSDKAGPGLAEALRQLGAEVDDAVIYDNRRVEYDRLPDFDAVFFASSSAVEAFAGQWGTSVLSDKIICAIGQPTARTLEQHGLEPHVLAGEATVSGAVSSLAGYYVSGQLADQDSSAR